MMAMMRMVASESRWLKRAAPSIEPQNSASRATCSRRCAGLVRVDQAGIQIGIDGHLLARHGIESEARRHFSRAHRAVADHQILNRDQCQKDDKADNVIAADHELAECLNHFACGRRAFAAVQQDAARAGQIERQPHQRQQQNETGKHRELHRAQHLDGSQQHQH